MSNSHGRRYRVHANSPEKRTKQDVTPSANIRVALVLPLPLSMFCRLYTSYRYWAGRARVRLHTDCRYWAGRTRVRSHVDCHYWAGRARVRSHADFTTGPAARASAHTRAFTTGPAARVSDHTRAIATGSTARASAHTRVSTTRPPRRFRSCLTVRAADMIPSLSTRFLPACIYNLSIRSARIRVDSARYRFLSSAR